MEIHVLFRILTWNKKNIVIKRYNHKNLFHSLSHSVMNSRAIRNWLHAQRITMLGILTPKPLAYIEQRKGFILWNSYYISEYADGRNLYNLLTDKGIAEREKASIKNQVEILLNKLDNNLITHGDLKHSNILITKSGPALTDLDSMKAHKFRIFYNIYRAKDIKRYNQKY